MMFTSAAAAPPLVVETDPLGPGDQLQKFHLPPGFSIELVVAEPDIGQPMNLHFDAAGRLWVTHSLEYPYPVAGEGVEPRDDRFGPLGQPPARDRVSVISGLGTGTVRVTHFAQEQNIPIGVLPLDPNAALIYSIPHLRRWDDTDGNGQADAEGRVLFGPFGNVDTHGMVNGLTYGVDGWVYACHGFRNTSTIQGTDGRAVTMNSGNTFRFLPDGSRVEPWTFGQVNPYGLTVDDWGHLFTADCHSKPLTCLIPGAYYPSFGKPHDGLGFGPDMIDHAHGSTGICGPCVYAADHFPAEFRDNIFLCNPVTGIVHRDRIDWRGSTPHVDTQPDFITCDDGWFRPVDLQLGPDGALYVADFYNAIIGHYEVPLEHPRRDRTHGRIWRVTYTGNDTVNDTGHEPARLPPPDLTRESPSQLLARLGESNLTTRVLAGHLLAGRHADDEAMIGAAHDLLSAEGRSLDDPAAARQRLHVMWLLHRLGALTADDGRQLAHDTSPLVRTHFARLLAGESEWNDADRAQAAALLRDDSARVRRAAAESWARHPHAGGIDVLLEQLPPPDTPDTHLRHAIRIALRNCLALPGLLATEGARSPANAEVASVCLAIGSPSAAAYLIQAGQSTPKKRWDAARLTHIARHATSGDLATLISLLSQPTSPLHQQIHALKSLEAGLALQAGPRPAEFVDWATAVAGRLLSEVADQPPPWETRSAGLRAPVRWSEESRQGTDGQMIRLWSSLPGGEAGVGVFRSPVFPLPEEFTFWLAGHDGFPQAPAAGRNLVRLIGVPEEEILLTVAVPRQDAPVPIVWSLPSHTGKPVRVELVDRLDLNAYAWTAAGRFSVDALNPPEYRPSTLSAELIGTLGLQTLRPQLERMLQDERLPLEVVRDLAEAQLTLQPDVRLRALLPCLTRTATPTVVAPLRQQLVQRNTAAIDELLSEALRSASGDEQQAMAVVLASSRSGAQQLIALVAAGVASPRVLLSAAVRQPLEAVADSALRERIDQLTRDLPPASDRVASALHQTRSTFETATASAERGHAVFLKQCAVCHQIGTEGKKVGPQLDGIGVRGLDRLLEDILDPNRNVDAAFRSTTVLTTDGRVLTGLLRREEGAALVLADTKGDEFRVTIADIEERALAPLSLMPEDAALKLPIDELHDLLAFLLSQTRKDAE